MVDTSGFLIAASVVTLVYVVAVRDLLLWWARRRACRARNPFVDPREPSAWGRRRRAATWLLAALGLGAAAWAWVEPYFPEVVHVRLASNEIHQSLRIVQISDLHSDERERLEDELPALVAHLRPDVVVFTGDAINSEEGLATTVKSPCRCWALYCVSSATMGSFIERDFSVADRWICT